MQRSKVHQLNPGFCMNIRQESWHSTLQPSALFWCMRVGSAVFLKIALYGEMSWNSSMWKCLFCRENKSRRVGEGHLLLVTTHHDVKTTYHDVPPPKRHFWCIFYRNFSELAYNSSCRKRVFTTYHDVYSFYGIWEKLKNSRIFAKVVTTYHVVRVGYNSFCPIRCSLQLFLSYSSSFQLFLSYSPNAELMKPGKSGKIE